MWLPTRIFTIILTISYSIPVFESKLIKFTKLECKSHDESFAKFEQCQLKVLGRDKVALQVHLKLLQKIEDGQMINLELFRKSHDFRPFLYNDTMDFCGFLKNPSRFMFWKVLVQQMIPFSNLNHTCPYENDIIVRDMILEEKMMKDLPFPPNDYMIHIRALKTNQMIVEVKVYILIKE